MLVVKALTGLVLVLAPIALCMAMVAAIGYATGVIAARWPLTRKLAVIARVSAFVFMGLGVVLGIVIAFGAVANADANAKAAMLAAGIAEAASCTAYLVPFGISFVILLWLAWRWGRRSFNPNT